MAAVTRNDMMTVAERREQSSANLSGRMEVPSAQCEVFLVASLPSAWLDASSWPSRLQIATAHYFARFDGREAVLPLNSTFEHPRLRSGSARPRRTPPAQSSRTTLQGFVCPFEVQVRGRTGEAWPRAAPPSRLRTHSLPARDPFGSLRSRSNEAVRIRRDQVRNVLIRRLADGEDEDEGLGEGAREEGAAIS